MPYWRCLKMIRYSDYDGFQDDVVMRDGRVVPFDRDAAREMAHHAHVLASDMPEQAVPVSVAERPVSTAA